MSRACLALIWLLLVTCFAEAEALKAFKKIDADGSGDLDIVEIERLTRYFGKPLSPTEMDAAFAEMDTDNSGTVDFGEFMEWWHKQNVSGRGENDGGHDEGDQWHEEVFSLLSAEVR